MNLKPIKQTKFESNLKRKTNKPLDYLDYFQDYIKKIPDFAIGPYFWLIPDQISMTFYAASSNIHLLTPYRSEEWTGKTVQFWIDNIHPEDRDFFISATYASIELHTTHDNLNINMYLRMADANREFRWVLIQYPTRCLNEHSEVISGLVVITDISHLDGSLSCMMTVMDKNKDTNSFYTLQRSKKVLKGHDLPKISKREREILTLMAKGLNTPQIADSLFISYHTVENHKRNLRHKTKAKTSAELMAYAHKYQML